MATSKSQRIGIWVIAIVMTVGTIGSFFVIVIANNNAANDQRRVGELQTEYKKRVDEYQKKVDEQTKRLSEKYYAVFAPYEKQPAKFDAKKIKELSTVDLKKGDGKTIGKNSEYGAYYIGWLPDGTVFDGSIDGKSLKAPVTSDMTLIQGWSKGMRGMKIGGVRVITIPSEQAYGENGSGAIPPNTPIRFVVMAIEKPEVIPTPELPAM